MVLYISCFIADTSLVAIPSKVETIRFLACEQASDARMPASEVRR